LRRLEGWIDDAVKGSRQHDPPKHNISDRRTVGQTLYNYTARELQKLVKKVVNQSPYNFWAKFLFMPGKG